MVTQSQRFLRHRGLIALASGGAAAEAGLLTLVAPNARPLAAQVTALPALAAYHDLRWLFAGNHSWFFFAAMALVVLCARAGLDTVLLRLAWPSRVPAPRPGRVFVSCLALTALAWLLLAPAATLALGVAVLPFSWPLIAGLPIMVGVMLALSHGGTVLLWHRRLPPPRVMGWLAGSFLALSAAAGVTAHAGGVGAVAVAALAGLVNARAWYGVAEVAARMQPRPQVSFPARLVAGLPLAPIAAVLVLALVAGVARLMFTGIIRVGGPSAPRGVATAGSGLRGASTTAAPRPGPGNTGGSGNTGGLVTTASADVGSSAKAILVVAGWGSSCCNAANALRAVTPGVLVRQFSYAGLDAAGQPRRAGAVADDIPLPELGDRIAAQVTALREKVRGPVEVVAESEGSLGVYAMLDRHPGVPVGSVVLLSPIVAPGQVSIPPQGSGPPEDALSTLNRLVGGMAPYGPAGAARLLGSVEEFGARYFGHVAAARGGPVRWLAVVPLADALTLPACGLPPDVVVVPALHGGLLGNPGVAPMISSFAAGHPAAAPNPGQGKLKAEAAFMNGAATAWRMPPTASACP